MSEDWTKWEGQVIDGIFPLRRFLNGSDHSAVYLTGYAAQNVPNAALKLVPAIPTLVDAQLAHWRAAAAVDHPGLVRLFECGRCQLGGLQFLYVVMEYAEQTLAQILPQRPLTPDEVKEMLTPTLNALGFLHLRALVQGKLRPSNILVVNDTVKLASDTLRPAGESTASIAPLSIYDPPESGDGSFSTPGDIWGLGVIIVEALTQERPSWPGGKSESPSLPDTLSPTFKAIATQCLSRVPAERPTVADLQARVNPADQQPAAEQSAAKRVTTDELPEPRGVDVSDQVAAALVGPALVSDTPAAALQAAAVVPLEPAAPAPTASAKEPAAAPPKLVISISLPLTREPPLPDTRAEDEPKRNGPMFAGIAIGALALAILITVWAATRHKGSPPTPAATASTMSSPGAGTVSTEPVTEEASRAPQGSISASSPRADLASQPTSAPRATSALASGASAAPADSSAPLHEEIPEVPRTSRETIHGHIKLIVKVNVDRSGNVVETVLEKSGPSPYFARLATNAARKWKFAEAAGSENSRTWLLHFDFARAGATGRATPVSGSR